MRPSIALILVIMPDAGLVGIVQEQARQRDLRPGAQDPPPYIQPQPTTGSGGGYGVPVRARLGGYAGR